MSFDSYSFGLDSDAEAALGGTFAQTRESVMGGKSDAMGFYQRLGQQLMQAMQPAPQAQQPQQALGAGGSLTDGFNMDWLSERLAAGSANGAKIGGMMGGK